MSQQQAKNFVVFLPMFFFTGNINCSLNRVIAKLLPDISCDVEVSSLLNDDSSESMSYVVNKDPSRFYDELQIES